MSALPNRQRAIASGSITYIMQELLQQLDLDYYRSALLLVARAELEPFYDPVVRINEQT
jgi:phosphoserine phosphatase